MGWVVNITPRPLCPKERPGTHCIGGWVGPRAGLDRWGKSRPPIGIWSQDRPARNESLYRLSYPSVLQYKIQPIMTLQYFPYTRTSAQWTIQEYSTVEIHQSYSTYRTVRTCFAATCSVPIT
jgi:hypothetical protein